LAQRFTGSYDILGCGDLVHIDDPITVILDGSGIATDATINLPRYNRCKRSLAPWDRQDGDADDAAQAAAATN
jgi:hypothetical protein